MNDQLVECVPNFSEGRDRAVIDAICAEIGKVSGVTLLDVDPGEATNRTVVTFVGSPDAVVEAAFVAIARAAELIDMSKHSGAHARHGAVDVCPFVPVRNVTVDQCVALAHGLGARVGNELGLSGYYYESAASRPERRSLADLRAGEYEALPEKLKASQWAPDFGPAKFNARFGVTTIGVRPFLIAYNINLNTPDAKIAKQIGLTMREKGRAKRDDAGKRARDSAGNLLRSPGLPHCRATGWYIEEYRRGQVTMNLTDYTVTPIHQAFDLAEALAQQHGARVTGSEIVGLVPLDALLAAGRHYRAKQGAISGVSEGELLDTAINSLGLSEVASFDPRDKIIEYRVAAARPLVEQTVERFVDVLASDAPAPGGGSVAALCASFGAALTAMVAALTYGKKGYRAHDERMDELGAQAQQLKKALLAAVDDDTFAFDAVMAAMRLPRSSEEEKAARQAAILAANKGATEVPLSVLERIPALVALSAEAAEKGNQNSLSDAGVASLMASAAAWGAYYNVLINLAGIDDAVWVAEVRARADAALTKIDGDCLAARDAVVEKLRQALSAG